MALNENSIFYKNLCCDSIEQYIEKTEVEDLVQAIGFSNPEAFVKRHVVWAWHQVVIANFFAGSIRSREPIYTWGVASEESMWKFLTVASAYFQKYTHLHTKDSTKNLYLRVCNLTDEGKANLFTVNSILTLVHERIAAFPSQEKIRSRKPKDNTEWQYFLLENVPFFQHTVHKECLELLERGVTYNAPNFNTLFTGYCYPNNDLKVYQERVSENFLKFLKVLIMLAYSYNNKKWIAPRPKNVKTYDETIKFFDFVRAYHGDKLEFLDSLIEASLPKSNNNYDTKENIPVLKFLNSNVIFENITKKEMSGKYPIPQGFEEAHAKYYNKEISMYEFSNMFHVSDTKIREWMKECNLPVRPRGIKNTELLLNKIVSQTKPLEPTVQPVDSTSSLSEKSSVNIPVEPPIAKVSTKLATKHPFTIKLFGYEISLGVKKAEPPKPVDMSDELKDFIEY